MKMLKIVNITKSNVDIGTYIIKPMESLYLELQAITPALQNRINALLNIKFIKTFEEDVPDSTEVDNTPEEVVEEVQEEKPEEIIQEEVQKEEIVEEEPKTTKKRKTTKKTTSEE